MKNAFRVININDKDLLIETSCTIHECKSVTGNCYECDFLKVDAVGKDAIELMKLLTIDLSEVK